MPQQGLIITSFMIGVCVCVCVLYCVVLYWVMQCGASWLVYILLFFHFTIELIKIVFTGTSNVSCTKSKVKYTSTKLKSCQARNRRLIKKIENLKLVANAPCKKCDLPSSIIKNASKYLKGTPLEIFKTQMKLANIAKKGRRYSNLQRSFCMGLYFQSPRAYRFMSKVFTLPTARMIRYWLMKIYMEVGWNNSVFSFLKEKASSLRREDKLCGVTFDAISIKSGIYYDKKYDKFVGFEDCGQYHKGDKPAQYAMVFMAKGLCRKWKMPLGYFLFHRSISAHILRTMIHDCVTKLLSCGLLPKFIVCDQDASNRSAVAKLNITCQKPFVEIDNEKIFFFYDTPHLLKSTRNIFIKYDISIGGDIVRWRYVRDFYEADKTHPVRIAPKLTDNHIDLNNFERMRVKYATQVLSTTVASGIDTYARLGGLPKEAIATSTFVKNMNEIFDVFNSSMRYSGNPRKCAIDGINDNLDFLTNMKEWIKSWKVIGTNRQIPSVQGWVMNISALQALWNDVSLKYDLQFLLTRRINQDCLENFFCCIRKAGGNNYTPNVQQLKNGMRNVLCNYMLSDAYNGNCDDDVTPLMSFINNFDKNSINDSQPSIFFPENTECSNKANENNKDVDISYDCDIEHFLESFNYELEESIDPVPNCDLDNFIDDFDDEVQPSEASTPLSHLQDLNIESQTPEDPYSLSALQDFIRDFDYTIDYSYEDHASPPPDNNDHIEDNLITYIAGYCCHRLFKIHICITCKSKLVKQSLDMDDGKLREIYLLNKGEGDFKRYLTHPTDQIFDVVKSFEKTFQNNIVSLIHDNDVKTKLYSYLSGITITGVCTEVEKIIKNVYLNMRLQYYAKFFNKTLRVKRKFTCTVDTAPARKCRKMATVNHN